MYLNVTLATGKTTFYNIVSCDIKCSVKIQIYTKVETITLRFMVIYLFSYSGDEGFQSFFNVYIL